MESIRPMIADKDHASHILPLYYKLGETDQGNKSPPVANLCRTIAVIV